MRSSIAVTQEHCPHNCVLFGVVFECLKCERARAQKSSEARTFVRGRFLSEVCVQLFGQFLPLQ